MTPPSQIAHYRVVSKLGEGGMGQVWRAHDPRLNRDVAIKVLPPALANDAQYMARFEREAQTLAALNHPNIAHVYGIEQGALIMELVEGTDLHGPLPPDTAIEYALQIAAGLEAAHDKGIVHRDLKPANIKVTPEGVVKILDFGLAKAAGETAAPTTTLSLTMTQAGMILGTAGYMSPEQARGQEVDRRADIWAFGAVLYEMLTGTRLFDGPTVSDTLAAVLTREPDFDQVPPRFRRLLRLCLARDLRRRLGHISAARVLLDEPEAPAPVVRAISPRPWIAATAVLALVAAASGIYAWRATRPVPRPLARLSVDLGVDALASGRNMATLSPDGTRVLYLVRNGQDKDALALRALDQPSPTVLPGTEGPGSQAFSPDSQWIAFNSDGKLKKVSVNGGSPVVVCETAGAVRGIAWGEDGSIVFAGEASGLRLVPAAGGVPRDVTNPAALGHVTHRFPQFLPGSRRVLFTAHNSTGSFDYAEIAVADLDTGAVKTVQRGGYYGRYLPSGHLAFARSNALFAVRFDPSRLAAAGDPLPLLDDLQGADTVGAGRFSFSSAGTFAYMAGRASFLSAPLVWLEPTARSQPLLPMTTRYSTPAVSPDGRSMALAVGTFGATDIHLWDFRREVMTRLTTGAHGNAFPIWTPDGKRVIYAASAGGKFSLWSVRADGAGEPVKLLDSTAELIPSSVLRDGSRVAYSTSGGATSDDLYTLPLDWSDPDHPKAGAPEVFVRTPGTDLAPVFSPDGRWIAYTSNEFGRHEVYVRPFPGPGGRFQVSAAGGVFPRWSPSGRQIYFAIPDSRMMVADVEAKDGGFTSAKPRVWSETRMGLAPRWTTFDVAPDGKIVAFVPDGEPVVARMLTHATFLLNFFDELKRRLP